MKPKSNLRYFLALAGSSLLAISSAHALPYYWDNNGTGTTGFGTAGGTWADTGSTLWSGSVTGDADATLGTNVITTTSDTLNFGTNTTGNGLATGTITVSGTVNSGNMTFGSQSGTITFSGGTINFANSVTITGNGTMEIGSLITGASTAITRSGVNGTLKLTNANNSYTGRTDVVGVIEATSITNGGLNSSIGASSNAAAKLIIGVGSSSGNLRYTGSSNASTDRLFTVGNSGATITNNGSGTLEFSSTGSVAYATSDGARSFTLRGTYTGGANTFNPLIADNGTGAVSFAKLDAGTWVLANNSNSYTGTTDIQNGVLSIGSIADYGTESAIGKGTAGTAMMIGNGGNTGTLNYTGGVQETNRFIQIGSNNLATGGATILNNGTGTLTFTASTFNKTYTNPNNNPRALTLGGTNNGVIQGTIQDSSSTAKGSVTKIGSGTWTLSGTNSYTQATAIQEGNLVAGMNSLSLTNGAFGNASSDINLGVASGNSDAGLLIGGAFNVGRNVRLLTNNTTDSGTRVLTIGGNTADNSEFSGDIILGTNSQAGRGVTLTAASGGQVAFSGVIQNPTSMDATTYTVTKAGAGTVVLSNTNTYTGNTSVNQGVLNTTKAAALPGYNASSKVTFNGGTLGVQVGGSGWTTVEVDTLLTNATKTSGALGIDTTNGNLTQWTVFSTTNLGTALGLTKLGTNTLTLDQANNYAGATTVSTGTLQLGNGSNTGSLTGTSGITNNANLTINRSNAFTQATDLNGKAITGTGSFTQAGGGTATLSLVNDYTGATTVSAGTLYVTGALSNSAVTVQVNGTVGSNGTAGVLGNGLTIDAGGNLNLTGATLGLNSTGVLSLTGGSLTLGNLTFQDLVGWDWANATAGTYKLINGAFTTNWGSTAYLDEASAYDFGNGNKGYFTSGSLNAVIVAVPEPSTVLLSGLGLLMLLRRRR